MLTQDDRPFTCPACERRAVEERKAASKCEQEVEELKTKASRLTLILVILATLVGKELLDEAIGLADSLPSLGSATPRPEPEIVDDQDHGHRYENSQDKQRERVQGGHRRSVGEPSVLFADVPPLLVNLTRDNRVFLFEEQVVVPSTISPLLAIALWKPRRRTE